MPSRKRSASSTRQKTRASAKAGTRSTERSAVAIYSEFSRWTKDSAPKWHPIQKMRYVFWRMMDGALTLDAIHEIHWSSAEFWHHVEVKREGNPFQREFKRAQTIQARVLADQVVQTAEARDAISKADAKAMRKIIRRTLKSLKGFKRGQSDLVVRMAADALSTSRKDLIARNKVQIDAYKWRAAKASPAEFADKSQLGISGPLPPDGPSTGSQLQVVFVTPAKGTKPEPQT